MHVPLRISDAWAHHICPRRMAAFLFCGSNLRPCIYYALSLPTELSSRNAWLHGNAFSCPRCILLCLWAQFLRSSLFLGLRLQITCLVTWEHNFSLCKVSWGSLIFIIGIPKVLTILQMFLICRFAWFLRELLQKPLKLFCFGKTRITDSNIGNIAKVPKS